MIALALALALAQGREAPLYIEQDGIVVIEIESHPPASGWDRETEHSGFTGSCYLTARGGSMMTFPIYILTPGRYTMQLHNRHDHPRRDLENDAFVRFDSGQFIKCFSGPASVWTWSSTLEYSGDNKVKPEYDLSAGLHKLQIRGRSPNFKIDRIAVFRSEGDLGKKAMDLSHPETRGVPPMPKLDQVAKAATAWSAGRLGSALKELESAAEGEGPASEQAKVGLDTLRTFIQERRAACEAIKSHDALAAAEALAFVAARFLGGSDAGKEMAAEARKWKAAPEAKAELKARRVLKMVEGQAEKIRRPGKMSDEQFARQYARPLAAIRQGLAVLRKSYPGTWCLKRVEQIASDYGLDGK